MSEPNPVNETQVLFGGAVEIAGYTVKPWTVKRFGLVYPAVKAIIDVLVEAGLTLDNLESFITAHGLELCPVLSSLLPDFLSASLEISREAAEELDWRTAVILTVTVFQQNLVPLKNFWTLIPQPPGGTRVSTPSP